MVHEMRRAGIRPDDAAIAADVAVRRMREMRYRLMQQARLAGLSYRQIARVIGVDTALVYRVLTSPRGKSTPVDDTL